MGNFTVKRLHLFIFGFLQNIPPSAFFNVNTDNPKIFKSSTPEFGYRVCQFGKTNGDSLLVTAPAQRSGTDGIYRCFYNTGSCARIEGKRGTAFGLSLTCTSDRAMVCGPRLTHDCDGFSYLNGLCVELGPQFNVLETQKPAFQECHDSGLDAVILFDDSQSISRANFAIMISFIKNIIRMFTDPRSQVAVAQYSTASHAVFHFENFAVDRDPESLLSQVQQSQGQTFTPSAIHFVLEQMFVEERGMRKKSKKLLVVITDGRSNDEKETFESVIPLAQRMGVTRYAIGVGKEYSLQELQKIASSPNDVFETDSFSALSSIQEQLGEKIFAIEGTGKSNFSAFQQELSQGGFSSAFSMDTVLFGAVGAYEWSGGFVEKPPGANSSFINASVEEPDIKDSYLGYSVAVAQLNGTTVYFAGAPRYQHTGLVLGFQQQIINQRWVVTHRLHGTQVGSYFGAELCVLHVLGASGAGLLLLVGVPQYQGMGFGGEVRVCRLGDGSLPVNCSLSLHGSPGNELGKFGASMSPIPDLNGDGFPELAVGAPMEDDGHGSMYIFLGRSGGLHVKHSQRILGRSVERRLRFFGSSVHSGGDLSSDGLSDLVVGAQAAAIVLRSQPVMCVSASMVLNPPVISQDFFHCAASVIFSVPVATATVCVAVVGVHTGHIQAPFWVGVSLKLELDGWTKQSRLLLSSSSWNGTVSGRSCFNISISVPACISNYTSVPMSGWMSVQGQTIENMQGLKPILSPSCSPSFFYPVPLEKVCGEDQICVSDLQVFINATSLLVVSTPGFPVEVVVTVFNHGEDVSGPELTLVHTSSLSYSYATKVSGRLSCVSVSLGHDSIMKTVCQLDASLLRQAMSMAVGVSLVVSDSSFLLDGLTVNVSVSSKNENDSTLHDNSISCPVSIRLPINVIMKEGAFTQYLSYPESNVVEHMYRIENTGDRAVPLNVSFVMPVELHSGLHWNVSLPKLNHPNSLCTQSNISTSLEKLCDGRLCHYFHCTVNVLNSSQSISFTFNGNVTADFKNPNMHVRLTSWGSLFFDELRYKQLPDTAFHSRSIISVLEATHVVNTSTIVLGSILGSLLIMTTIFGALYRVGFFKSKFAKEVEQTEEALHHDDKEMVLPDAS